MDFRQILLIDVKNDAIDLRNLSEMTIITQSDEMLDKVSHTLKHNFGVDVFSRKIFEKMGFNLDEEYVGPIYENPYYFIFWFLSNRTLLLAIEHSYNKNVEWMLRLITYLTKNSYPLSIEILNSKRYEYLDFITNPIIDEHTGHYLDLFYTFPQSFFLDTIIKPINNPGIDFENLPETPRLDDEVRIIEFLLSQANDRKFCLTWLPIIINRLNNLIKMEVFFPENILIVINAIDALLQIPPSPLCIPPIIEILNCIENLEELSKFPSILQTAQIQKWFLKREIPQNHIETTPFLPSLYSLIPEIIPLLNGSVPPDSSNQIWKMRSTEGQVYRGLHLLLEYFGDYSFSQKKYVDAENFYFEAQTAFPIKNPSNLYFKNISSKLMRTRLQRILQYFTSSLLHLDLHQFEKAISFGWSGIRLALTMLQQGIKSKVDIKESVISLINELPFVKNSLISLENEMTPVIELKLDELIDDLKAFVANQMTLEDFAHKLEVNQDAFTYLMPQSPPRFLLLTPDGRLLYSVNADYDLSESDSSSESHLLAGVLTAIRTIFLEASISGSGNVKEIDAGDSTLYIEARDSLVIVVSAVTMTQELREFTNWIADSIQLEFEDIIQNWDGSSRMLYEMIEFLRFHIKEKLLTN